MKLIKTETLAKEITTTIPGFGVKTFKVDFKKPTHISALVNMILSDFSCHDRSKSSWSWGDIPSPEDGFYQFERTTEKVLSVSIYECQEAIEGTAQDTTYKHYILKISPKQWDLYESEHTETIYAGGLRKVTSGGSTSWDSDGFMNK